jgi:hypothetical protein
MLPFGILNKTSLNAYTTFTLLHLTPLQINRLAACTVTQSFISHGRGAPAEQWHGDGNLMPTFVNQMVKLVWSVM